MSDIMISGTYVPDEVIDGAPYCVTGEDFRCLLQENGITLTDDQMNALAEAVMTDDPEGYLDMNGDCGGSSNSEKPKEPEYTIVLDQNGYIAECPYCHNPIYPFDWCMDCYAYACNFCGADFEHDLGDTSKIYVYQAGHK